MRYKIQQEEVLRVSGNMIRLDRKDIESLKKKAGRTKRKRIRICIHKSDKDIVHEMFIVHTKHTYIRPHKHLAKKESLHILEGVADILLFDERGKVQKIIPMGDYRSGLAFYMKMETPLYHSMIIYSDCLVFVEITNGPFRKNETLFASWSPDEMDRLEVKKYQHKLMKENKNKLRKYKITK